jgi:hypothetical protein
LLFVSPDDASHLDSMTVIAAVLNVPLGTVKSRIARGINHLQELLGLCERTPQRVAA